MSTAVPNFPPPLREGDRLSREEFLRRWEAMPDLKRAELIDGVVYMPSPVGLDHGHFHSLFSGWLANYVARTPGCSTALSATWLMEQDAPQPDLSLRIRPEHGGQSHLSGKFAAGAPELVVEISVTTRAFDQGRKLDLYRRAGVREYIIVAVPDEEIIWRELINGRYRKMPVGKSGVLRSKLFPGLWLDLAMVWRQDFAGTFQALQRGLDSPEHAAFVARLAEAKR